MTTAPAPVLEIRDLSVSFPTETGTVSAVDGVSLDLAAGEIVGMVGESGCGKSVTAMSLAGLLPGSARVTGSVRLDGTQLVGARESALHRVRGREIAYIFQEPMTSLNPVLTTASGTPGTTAPAVGGSALPELTLSCFTGGAP
ncbi:ATP-binding cassette domain-containing protein, partial [Micromonospora sp. NPDC047753]|uniref:ATP-binding cassette domain-containing protein n=1 Tax=Micromonospora sp. NPDC047753 TaxID=3154817 RepID=UPI0034094182